MRKYSRGRRIKTMSELTRLIENSDFIYWQPKGTRGKPLHTGWIKSYQFRYLLMVLKQGDFYISKKEA